MVGTSPIVCPRFLILREACAISFAELITLIEQTNLLLESKEGLQELLITVLALNFY